MADQRRKERRLSPKSVAGLELYEELLEQIGDVVNAEVYSGK